MKQKKLRSQTHRFMLSPLSPHYCVRVSFRVRVHLSAAASNCTHTLGRKTVLRTYSEEMRRRSSAC